MKWGLTVHTERGEFTLFLAGQEDADVDLYTGILYYTAEDGSRGMYNRDVWKEFHVNSYEEE